MTTDKPRSPRFVWLIPLVMLALAILACDDVYIPPPSIDRVEAQAGTPGRAYARVIHIGLDYKSSDADAGDTVVYETDNYGSDWRPSEHVFAEAASNSYPMIMSGESLKLNGRAIWSFPRPIFRSIFYDGSNVGTMNQVTLPYSDVSNSAAGDNVYIAMGTEGVLVGTLDANGLAPDWHLGANGMDALAPLPLTISEPSIIVGIVLLILLVPPFALIHAYLLQRIWAYVLPAAEARRMALKVTAGLVLLAIIGSIYWLTNDRIDLYQVIGVLTLITVIVGLTVTVQLAQQAQVSNYTRNRLAVAALLLSLVVPGGVAAIFAMWWLVFGLVFGYWAYQRVYRRYFNEAAPTPEGRVQRWRVDRLALEMVLIFGVGLVVTYFVIIVGQAVFGRFLPNADLINFLALVVGFAYVYLVIRHYSSRRAKTIITSQPEVVSSREVRLLSGDLWMHTVFWLFWSIVATGVTLFGQAWAYGWFTTLLKTNPIP